MARLVMTQLEGEAPIPAGLANALAPPLGHDTQWRRRPP